MKWLWVALNLMVFVIAWLLIKPAQQAADVAPLEPQELVASPVSDAPQKALPPNPKPVPQPSAPDPR